MDRAAKSRYARSAAAGPGPARRRLALRAVVRSAARDLNLLDGRFAALARRPLAPINAVLDLKPAAGTIRIEIVIDTGSAGINGFGENAAQSPIQPSDCIGA